MAIAETIGEHPRGLEQLPNKVSSFIRPLVETVRNSPVLQALSKAVVIVFAPPSFQDIQAMGKTWPKQLKHIPTGDLTPGNLLFGRDPLFVAIKSLYHKIHDHDKEAA